MQKGTLLIVGLLIGVAVIAFVLVNGMPKPNSMTATQTASPIETMAPATSSGENQTVREFTVTAQEYSFSPTTLTVKEGETVKVTFKNGGKMPHDFVIDELGAKAKVISGGSEETVTFTASKKGTFEYYCSVGNHRKMGMVGKIMVE